MPAARIALPPKQLFLSSSLILVGLVALCVWLIWNTPWMGIRLAATDAGDVQIHSFSGDAEVAGLKIGDTVRALRTVTGVEVPVHAGDLIEEPDFHTDYADLNDFLSRQTRLSEVLATGRVGVVTGEGATTWVEVGKRPVLELPVIFWFQIVCGSIAWLVGTSVFVYRQSDLAARLYAVTGVTFALITFSAAIYSGRELALDGELFRALSVLNHAGAFTFAAAFVSLLCIYPARLFGNRVLGSIFAIYLLVWVCDTLQWSPDMNFGIRYPILAGMTASFVLGAMQWRNSRVDPVDRAALKWFLLTLLLGSAVFVFGVFGMSAAGHMPVIPQGYAFGMVLMMYLGMALGMKRYRLFNLESWWPEVWLWLLGGVLVLGFDLVLVQVLTRNEDFAFALALAIAGWIYFPLRQWLLRRAGRTGDWNLSGLIPELLEIASTPRPEPELRDRWHQLLDRAYAPLALDQGQRAVREASVADNGLRLIVPGLGNAPALILGYANNGKRLFLHADAQHAQALWELLSQVLRRQDAHLRGAQEERERIAKDMHDDIGAKLLTLIHRSESAQLTELLRGVMLDLRSLVASLDRPPAPLDDALGDWRRETEDRCDAAGVALIWNDNRKREVGLVRPRQRLTLERLLREAITNALKHAHPGQIRVDVTEEDENLLLRIQDDGDTHAAIVPTSGRGVRNMVARMAEAGGSVVFKPAEPKGSRVEIRLPFLKLQG